MNRLLPLSFFCFSLFFFAMRADAQSFSRQDSLRGGNGPGRNWWDVQHYNLSVEFDLDKQSIDGTVEMAFKVTRAAEEKFQIDLQDGMFLDDVSVGSEPYSSVKEGNAWWITANDQSAGRRFEPGKEYTMRISFHGKPRVAKHPPWDGGFIWTKDSTGKAWIAVACQGLGASSWWPCKDAQSDEPDRGVSVNITGTGNLTVISNGRLKQEADTTPVTDPATGITRLHISSRSVWSVTKPINLYDVTFYIGDYIHWQDKYKGEKGNLDLDYYVLRYNEEKARKQFAVVQPMMQCFERWMGPYPFYEDGYKLVEAPYLGMEHQSAVAYGNKYKMGYLGQDISNTGEGLTFDFIIIHESGHEWFGNNITAADVADNWIHEGITTYSEALFLECQEGKEAAFRYTTGQWKAIENNEPVVGPYGVNKEGEDIYNKGSAVIHMIRLMMKDDEKFRQLIRGLNREFYHQTVSSKQVEDYIIRTTGLELGDFFDLYLRETEIPTLAWNNKKGELHFKWFDAPAEFMAPVSITAGGKESFETIGSETTVKLRRKGDNPQLKAAGLYKMEEMDF